MDLKTALSKLTGIGPALGKRLERLELFSLEDLIYHFPFRYDDFSKASKIADAKLEEIVTLQGQIWQIKNAYTRFRKVITKAILNDGTASIELVWFNQPYLTKSIQSGDTIHVAGKVTKYGSKLSIMVPDWEKWDKSIHTGRLVPIYPETANLSSKWFRNILSKLLPSTLPSIREFLPDQIRDNMLALPQALQKIHSPKDYQDIKDARKRLGFDELFLIQLATLKVRLLWNQKTVIKSWSIDSKKLESFIESLPFQLTAAQQRVLAEIISDLQKATPMNRLLQGEVGSGKTVVAAAAIYLAHLNSFQSLLMAPTEILAWQHYETVKKLLEPFGIKIGIYTGSKKSIVIPRDAPDGASRGNLDSKKIATSPAPETVRDPRNDEHDIPNVIIGTHALLSDKIQPERVGLVVIDEQHRFGVEQRTLLRQKGAAPHLLTMTATPIPRTVALTLYGDLELSIIDELPKNRPPVKTYLVPEEKRADGYKFIEKKVWQEGDQVYIITPLIEPSETLQTAKAAKVEYERLQKVFSKLKLGLLHGRMRSKEKEEVLAGFRRGQIQILVATSVVEVGMDIPNATIMIIEGAERFGLAQLHQLRGRIGRGTKKSYCLLYTSDVEASERNRLKYLETTFDGLKLAELDLKIRGSGTIFSTAQHGRFDLKIARLSDLPLIERARGAASKILADDLTLDKYPLLRAQLENIAHEVMPD